MDLLFLRPVSSSLYDARTRFSSPVLPNSPEIYIGQIATVYMLGSLHSLAVFVFGCLGQGYVAGDRSSTRNLVSWALKQNGDAVWVAHLPSRKTRHVQLDLFNTPRQSTIVTRHVKIWA